MTRLSSGSKIYQLIMQQSEHNLPQVVSQSVMKRFDYIFPKYLVKAAKSWFGFRNSVCKIFKLSSEMKIVQQGRKRSRKDHQTLLQNSRYFVNYLPGNPLIDIETGYHRPRQKLKLFRGSFSKKRSHLYGKLVIIKD